MTDRLLGGQGDEWISFVTNDRSYVNTGWHPCLSLWALRDILLNLDFSRSSKQSLVLRLMSPVILHRDFASHLLSLWFNSAEDAEWSYITHTPSPVPPIFYFTMTHFKVKYLWNEWCQDNVQHLITTESGNGPVAADAGGKRRQLKDKGANIGVGISVRGCDIDPGVWACALTHLGLPGYQHWWVVVHIDQVDLKSACPAGLWRTWREVWGKRGGKEIKWGRRINIRKDGEIIM